MNVFFEFNVPKNSANKITNIKNMYLFFQTKKAVFKCFQEIGRAEPTDPKSSSTRTSWSTRSGARSAPGWTPKRPRTPTSASTSGRDCT